MTACGDPEIIAWSRVKLSQRHYATGHLYVCGIFCEEKLEAIDVRYWMDTEELIPTKSGFRIYSAELPAFLKVMQAGLTHGSEVSLWDGGHRSLLARSVSDQYGVGIDFRYFKKSVKYTGWEKRGIRFAEKDFQAIRQIILSLGLHSDERPLLPNLFLEHPNFAVRHSSYRKGDSSSSEAKKNSASFYVNDSILAFLGEEED